MSERQAILGDQHTHSHTTPHGHSHHATTSHQDYKSISNVRSAFHHHDVQASRREHMKAMEQHSSDASDYVKSVVFGGLDGIMTVFAIIAAAAGSGASYVTILIFGFSNVVADAFSMGFSEFVSGSAELDNARQERSREEWEVENSKDLEIEEMVQLYMLKGLSEEDAKTMVNIISKDNKIFVDFMMHDELGILCDSDDPMEPLKQGVVMFLSFITFGSVPLLGYAVSMSGDGMDSMFFFSCALTALALLTLGAIKGYLTGMNIPRSSLLMVVNGVISGAVSFGISYFVDALVHPDGGAVSL
mmetsp:Transcript_75527/g.87809  ORF Transcript_75527/g.87809 Transcript_75527/m.87809 type:complete len:302 (-) Transcript_75527:77-982(-)